MKTNIVAVLSILMLIFGAVQAFAGAEAELWDRWVETNESNTDRIDHSDWQIFINRYRVLDRADNVVKIQYGDVSEDDRELLDDYIDFLQGINIDVYNPNEQFAYWVNLYNAATIQLILDSYPVESIRRINNPWDRELLTVAGEDITLNDIEHRILRPRWKDPRIHFVVNCASIGCPNLPAQVLTTENTEEILESSAVDYINHPRGATIQGNALLLSSIFDWYMEDFGEDETDVLNYIAQYRDIDALVQQETNRNIGNVNVRYDYSWRLNDI